MKKQHGFMHIGIITVFLLVVGLLVAIGFRAFMQQQPTDRDRQYPAASPSQNQTGWKTISTSAYEFSYPEATFKSPNTLEQNVILASPAAIESPRSLPEDGIWVEATVYPSDAKTNLISDVEALINAANGSTVKHPITPYPVQFIKSKNVGSNGVIISLDEKEEVLDATETTTAIWLQDDKVYQLRLVVMKRSVSTEFMPNFEKIVNSFKIK